MVEGLAGAPGAGICAAAGGGFAAHFFFFFFFLGDLVFLRLGAGKGGGGFLGLIFLWREGGIDGR